nr:hypothetical protein [uncultured Gellertiella sp.]
MATVIYLKDRQPSAKRQHDAAAHGTGGTAQLLLFTGVRYERLTPETRPTSSGSKRARKR